MKKLVFIAVCTVSLMAFTSCGSSAPCGLAKKSNQTIENNQQEVLVANATQE